MPKSAKAGLPIIGIVFFLLGLFKFVSGDNWVVWVILGVLFGGLGFLGAKKPGGDRHE
jgi:hypothetical protein